MNLYLLILLALAVAILFPPGWLISWIAQRSPVIFKGKAGKRRVAITIDDGIKGESTIELLKVSAKYNIKLTWFLIGGNCEVNDPRKHLLKTMKLHGHQIGNHGWTDKAAISLDHDTRFDQIVDTDQWIGSTTIYRPGSGWFNSDIVNTAAALGKRTVLGSVYAHDPITRFIPWFVIWYTSWKAVDGDIIVLHDFPGAGYILEQIVLRLQAQDLEMVTVDELMT